jgi:hypothetical protein
LPCTQYRKTHFPSGVDIRVEAASSVIRSLRVHYRRFARIVGGELDCEFEKAVLIWRSGCAYDQGFDMTDIRIWRSNGDSFSSQQEDLQGAGREEAYIDRSLSGSGQSPARNSVTPQTVSDADDAPYLF